MKTKVVSLTLLILFFAAGCANPVGEPTAVLTQATDLQSSAKASLPTLTLGENGCIYNGPPELPAKFDLTWIAEDLGRTGYMHIIATLDEGKTLADLSSIVLEKPLQTWVHSHGFHNVASPGTYTKTYDLNTHASFEKGPIYFVCILPNEGAAGLAVGAAGPIDIVK